MSFERKVEILSAVKNNILNNPPDLQNAILKAGIENKWFTHKNTDIAINAIADKYLDKQNLLKWLSAYNDKQVKHCIGIIAAGNIPLVGFHDLLCAFICDAPVKIKLSSKDYSLMEFFIELLKEYDPEWRVEIVEKLSDFDAVIATGSNNTNRYFEYYFKNAPTLLRQHRNSVAILDGSETKEDLRLLAHDIFQYFGMGCRNVTQILIPAGYDPASLFEHFSEYSYLAEHQLYKDNFDYNCTLLLMNKVPHLANYFVILKEDQSIQPRLATVHYSFYNTSDDIENYLNSNKKNIQCIVGNNDKADIPFGKAQKPELTDYADNTDTLQFLLSL
jgi:hypothetical protein